MNDKRRPVYVISHMNNKPEFVEGSLQHGANAIECDIECKPNGDSFSYRAFHGFAGPAYTDERAFAATGLDEFLASLRPLGAKYEPFSLLVFDCKVGDIPADDLAACGSQLCRRIRDALYADENAARETGFKSLISTGSGDDVAFLRDMPKVMSQGAGGYVGFAIDQEQEVHSIESFLADLDSENVWFGYGNNAQFDLDALRRFDRDWRSTVMPVLQSAVRRRSDGEVFKGVHTWTVVLKNTMSELLKQGVDGIMVDPEFHAKLDQGFFGRIASAVKRIIRRIFGSQTGEEVLNNVVVLSKLIAGMRFRSQVRLATREDDPFQPTAI